MPIPLTRPNVLAKQQLGQTAPKTVPPFKLIAGKKENPDDSGRMHVAADQDVEIPDLSLWRGR